MSAKTRLFLTIERLKNHLDDAQMRLPYWEQFFPLFSTTSNTVTLDMAMVTDLINEAAVAAENRLVMQGATIYSQYTNNAPDPVASAGATTANRLPPLRVVTPAPAARPEIDYKKYSTYTNKVLNYFVSAGVSSTAFRVKDIVMMYLYTSSVPKLKPLFNLLDAALMRGERDCVMSLDESTSSLVLDNLRDVTGVTNIRLDYESVVYLNNSIQKALNNELAKYPVVKVRDRCSMAGGNIYDKITDPCKAFVDKFSLLVGLKVQFQVKSCPNNLCTNPVLIENVAINVEKACDMNRMVFNAINNIFINTVEQCAIENIRFDAEDFSKKFRLLDRVREMGKNNVVEKEAAGDLLTRKRLRTATNRPPSELKRLRAI
ncbi:P40 [Betabaculovirus altermyunipunctae]|uniref:P40 n=1 Tax=Betabaculovirus altermyunipunctae TaxID=3051996 RepID=A0A1S5YE96_9BBAC|nr:P40 [Betabaculovirus altermyunipunctae]AQQ80354.1 P40 [Betabaculovirus altermyunipunctae]